MDNIKDLMKNKKSMDSLIIYKNGRGYEVNQKTEDVFDTRSIAKTILSLACGILIDKNPNDFNLETHIYPIINDKINVTNKKNIKKLEGIRVIDLLTHTTGYRDLVLFSKDVKKRDEDQLLDYVANYEIYYQPGRHFLYSNAGYYLLAATMEEFLGYPLSEFVYENLFRPLEIKDRTWDKYGPYLAGATKLYLSADDMLKIGKLIINKGRFNGKQIISSSYVEEMLKPKFKNPNESKREYLSEDYYGLGIWISEAGVIFASGTGGQLIVILHDRDTIIITTNTGADSKSYKIKSDVDNIIKSIYAGRN